MFLLFFYVYLTDIDLNSQPKTAIVGEFRSKNCEHQLLSKKIIILPRCCQKNWSSIKLQPSRGKIQKFNIVP